MEVTKFEIRKDGDSHIASFTVRLNTDTDKFNDKMEEILDRTRKKLEDMHKINPGDYFIARKPKDATGGLPWIDAMDKFDGVIQKCASSGEYGRILSENTFMDTWWYDPSWCEKVSPGDVMKTGKHTVFIFKKLKNGEIFDYAFYSENIGLIIDENTSIPNPLHLPFSHATSEEAKPLFDALARAGKRWNKEKLQVEDIVWEPKAGDVCTNKYGSIFIYREKCFSDIEVYAALYNNAFFVDKVAFNDGVRLATYEERCQFFERLVKEGYKWNAKKLKLTKVETKPNEEITRERINFCNGVKISCGTWVPSFLEMLGVEKWTPKVGEFVAHKGGWIYIHKGIENGRIKRYAALSPNGNVYYKYSTHFVGVESDLRGPATESECQKLIEALKKEGKQWNAEKMCIEDMPKFYTRPKKDFILSGISKMSPIEIDEAVLFVSALSDREKRGIEDNPKDKTIPKSTPATYEEVLRSCGCSDEEIRRMGIIEDKPKELTESLANDLIKAIEELDKSLAEFNEILPGFMAGIMRDMSYSLGKRDALKQVIKLCKKLLNE